MDRGIKRHLTVAAGCLGFFILLSAFGGYLEKSGAVRRGDLSMPAYVACLLAVFLLLGCSLVRPLLRLFVYLQGLIGNAELPIVRFVARHESPITRAVWACYVLGLAIAIPAMVRLGFFSGLPVNTP